MARKPLELVLRTQFVRSAGLFHVLSPGSVDQSAELPAFSIASFTATTSLQNQRTAVNESAAAASCGMQALAAAALVGINPNIPARLSRVAQRDERLMDTSRRYASAAHTTGHRRHYIFNLSVRLCVRGYTYGTFRGLCVRHTDEPCKNG